MRDGSSAPKPGLAGSSLDYLKKPFGDKAAHSSRRFMETPSCRAAFTLPPLGLSHAARRWRNFRQHWSGLKERV